MISISVFADDAINAMLVSDHISQYLTNTGFSDVNVERGIAPQITEPASQTEALQAIRNLNPGLFSQYVNIMPEISGESAVPFPDMPD